MAIDMTSEQKEIGKANFERTVGGLAELDTKSAGNDVSRRQFMKGLLAAGATLPVAAGTYFGYKFSEVQGRPVKAALIGGGDEGGVLVGEHNPDYLQFVAVADLRPSNQERIFEGQGANHIRKGFKRIYGQDAKSKIEVFDDYKKMLAERKDIEAVVIALPLHIHAQAAIDCMKAGQERGKPIHVLCEKLMAWNVRQCKQMIDVAEQTDSILSIGHQRHYSLLYAHAVEVLKSGVLGDIKHIRALWHRNNSFPLVDAKGVERKDKAGNVLINDSWRREVDAKDREALEKSIRQRGYKNMEELVRWRLYNRTGGGLMAELGSHQLDACSIFLGKVHPLAVSGYGGKIFYHDDREVEDHVFTTFEFPGKNYYEADRKTIKDKNDIVVVTYSSINTNAFEPYGECVMGSRGTLVVEEEQKAMLWPERGGARNLSVTVTQAGGGTPVIDASATSGPPPASSAQNVGSKALGAGPISRGYREEMEHFAYCVRMLDQVGKDAPKEEKDQWRLGPRCHGKVAMADAIIALTSNLAMKKNQRIEFKPEWFDPKDSAVPDPDMVPEEIKG